jgi:hypothetical protein
MKKGTAATCRAPFSTSILQEAICRSSFKHGDEFSRFVAARELLSG